MYQRLGIWRDERRLRPSGDLNIGGRHLHVDCQGSGKPVVILEAGLAATSLSWALVQREVSTFTRVCSYDRAGLGWSASSHEPLSLFSMVADLGALVERETNGRPAVLVGHSFGALLVRVYASKHPDRVAGLVLVDPVSTSYWGACDDRERHRLRIGAKLSRRGAWLAELGVVRLCLWVMTSGHTRLPKLVARVTAGQGTNLLSRLTGEMRRLPSELWPQVRAHWSRASSFRTMAGYLDALPENCRGEQDTALPPTLPLTILSAQTATEAERRERDGWASHSAIGRHLLIPDCGHWIQLQQPDRVTEAIRQMLENQNISFSEN